MDVVSTCAPLDEWEIMGSRVSRPCEETSAMTLCTLCIVVSQTEEQFYIVSLTYNEAN